MRTIVRVLVITIGTAGLLGMTATISNANGLPDSSPSSGVSDSVGPGTEPGNHTTGTVEKPAGEIEKARFQKQDPPAGTIEDGPSEKPGFHEWIDRWDDCKKKERLEREQQERLHHSR